MGRVYTTRPCVKKMTRAGIGIPTSTVARPANVKPQAAPFLWRYSARLAARRKAWAKSLTRSSGCSIPTDRRISPSVTPAASRTACGTPECVVEAGWQTSDSVPPRLTASLNSSSAFRMRKPRARSSATTKAKVEPGPVHCRA